MAAIDIRQLMMKFGDYTALEHIDLDVAEGEFLTLLGPSGCGKTTLLKLISGFLKPTAGSIAIDGEDVTNLPPESRNTALCFQSYALFPHLTVYENLAFGLRQKRVPTAEREARIADVADKLGLSAQLQKLPNQLSGGQQQRVSLGRALVMRPRVILFDEPLSNLDAKLRDQVRIEIRRIQREYGLTAIYVTHDQAEAMAMSDRVVVLYNGRIEQMDTPERLYHAPRTAFVADFIGAANILDAEVVADCGEDIYTLQTAIGVLRVRHAVLKVGDKVDIAWRPEHAQLVSSDHPEGLSAQVVNRAFQGQYTDLWLDTAQHTYRIQVPESDAKEGDIVTVHIPASRVRVLEKS